MRVAVHAGNALMHVRHVHVSECRCLQVGYRSITSCSAACVCMHQTSVCWSRSVTPYKE